MVDRDLKKILKLVLRDEIDLENCAITILSEEHIHITPVIVTNTARNYEKHLIIKWRKTKPVMVTKVPIFRLFSNEIFIYTTVLEKFQRALRDFEIAELSILPHCLGTSTTADHQALALEDLLTQNFIHCNPKIPLEMNHVKYILKAYAQWHGLSYILKIYYNEDFKAITEDAINTFPYMLQAAGHIKYKQNEFNNLKNEVFKNEDKDMFKILSFSNSDIEYALTAMSLKQHRYHVITHGNCWIHNFMFSYKDGTGDPTCVKILDWQCCGLTSPVFDLSLFIYSCINTKAMENVVDLLRIYHYYMQKLLERFHVEIQDVFPFKVLKSHWRKFSHYGLLLSSRSIKFCLSDGAMTKTNEFLFSTEEYCELLKRIRNNFLHYVHNVLETK